MYAFHRGLTEEGVGWEQEMGLTETDLRLMETEYVTTLLAMQKKVVETGGFMWQLMNCFHAPTDPTKQVEPANWSQSHYMPFYNDRLCHYSSQTAPNRSQVKPPDCPVAFNCL